MEIEDAIKILESEVEDIYSSQQGCDEEIYDFKLARAIEKVIREYKTYKFGYEDFEKYVKENAIYIGDIKDKMQKIATKEKITTNDLIEFRAYAKLLKNRDKYYKI